jgi:hypothetical protein
MLPHTLDPAELHGVKAARPQKKIKKYFNYYYYYFNYYYYYFGWDIYDSHRCPSKNKIKIKIKNIYWGRAALIPRSSAGSSAWGTPNLL